MIVAVPTIMKLIAGSLVEEKAKAKGHRTSHRPNMILRISCPSSAILPTIKRLKTMRTIPSPHALPLAR